jgi:RNA polymerase sigma factor (sigma-70 family)
MKSNYALAKHNDQPQLCILGAAQDSTEFETLYKQYWSILINFAGQYIEDRQTCEEIVQELFVQLYTRGLSVKIKHTLTSYLFVALRNRIFNFFRNRAVYRKHVTIAAKKRMTLQNDVEQSLYLKELEKSVLASLQRMPARCSEVYMLKQEQLTVKQISTVLNRPSDTVEKQLRKARKMLIEHLSSDK